ncbi:MAG: nucleotidyltransferase domain-containing protein [Mobilicoccus sp.]|nr:nucleotidyltransferase domain-containing protein [Mobilicoccus sp.]
MSTSTTDLDALIRRAVEALVDAGARVVFLHGSQATGQAGPASDIDLAALFDEPAPAPFDIPLPTGVDLLVLNEAPLEVAGRIALHGRVVHESDMFERVDWQARTRKIYLDERPRIERARAEFLEAMSRG